MNALQKRKETNRNGRISEEIRPRRRPFSPWEREKVAEGRMRGFFAGFGREKILNAGFARNPKLSATPCGHSRGQAAEWAIWQENEDSRMDRSFPDLDPMQPAGSNLHRAPRGRLPETCRHSARMKRN